MSRRPSLIKTSESLEFASPQPQQRKKRRSAHTTAQADNSAKPSELESAVEPLLNVIGLLWRGLFSGIRVLGRINPRLAIAVVSCALFAVLLTRISAVQRDGKLALIAPTTSATTVTQLTEPPRQPEEPKQALAAVPSSSVAAARIIDAPAVIGASCREQAWPYVTGACLTDAGVQTQPEPAISETVVPATSSVTDVTDHVVPAVLVDANDAQANMSPEHSLSVVIDKPRHVHSVSRRHHQVHAERKRHRPRPASQEVAFGTPSFEPLKSSNVP